MILLLIVPAIASWVVATGSVWLGILPELFSWTRLLASVPTLIAAVGWSHVSRALNLSITPARSTSRAFLGSLPLLEQLVLLAEEGLSMASMCGEWVHISRCTIAPCHEVNHGIGGGGVADMTVSPAQRCGDGCHRITETATVMMAQTVFVRKQ